MPRRTKQFDPSGISIVLLLQVHRSKTTFVKRNLFLRLVFCMEASPKPLVIRWRLRHSYFYWNTNLYIGRGCQAELRNPCWKYDNIVTSSVLSSFFCDFYCRYRMEIELGSKMRTWLILVHTNMLPLEVVDKNCALLLEYVITWCRRQKMRFIAFHCCYYLAWASISL